MVRFLFSFYKDCIRLKIDLQYTFETGTERNNEANFYELDTFSPSRRYVQILPPLTIKALFFLEAFLLVQNVAKIESTKILRITRNQEVWQPWLDF